MENEIPTNEQAEQAEQDEKLAKGCMGCFTFVCLFITGVLILIYGMGFIISDKTEIVWYGRNYYLQQERPIMGEDEHNLFYRIDGERVLLLPQVYGYKKEGTLIYIAAVHGYTVINLKDGSADVFLQSKQIERINSTFITYHDDFSFFDNATKEKLLMLPHDLTAYFSGFGGAAVGDGKFQCMYLYDMDDNGSYSLEVYEPYVNSWHDILLPYLNGYRIEKKSQLMYASSPHGYAIVDGPSGTCRVYFTDQELAEKDYQKDIYVLDSFEVFTPEEQEILRKVEKEGL